MHTGERSGVPLGMMEGVTLGEGGGCLQIQNWGGRGGWWGLESGGE